MKFYKDNDQIVINLEVGDEITPNTTAGAYE